MKTLVVDDNIMNRESMQAIMKPFGQVRASSNGHEALDFFKRAIEMGNPFDIVLLDIAMPEISGLEVLVQIRQIEDENIVPEKKQAKVLMVTSHSQKDLVIASKNSGCDGYIIKPFKSEVILKKLKELKLIC